MSETLYKINRDQCIDLIGMLVYNHRIVGQQMNLFLEEEGYPTPSTVSQWRYYLNMSGQYHERDHDYVRAINAKLGVDSPYMQLAVAGASGPVWVDLDYDYIHGPMADTAVMIEYRYNSRAYKQLVSRYPECEELIFGIFYPVDINKAIASEEGDILFVGGYERVVENEQTFFVKSNKANVQDLNLIEPNEYSLIQDLENYIKYTISRWFNSDYVTTDDLYLATFHATLCAMAVPRVMKFRIDRCKTSEAHSFHVRQYLDDFGGLGSAVDYMPLKAVHYLYRNAEMLRHEAGKATTTRLLVDNVLDPSQIPLTAHQTRQDISSIEDHYVPNAFIRTTDVGKVKSISGDNDIGVLALNQKLSLEAPENTYDFERVVDQDTDDIASRYADYLPVKTLESKVVLSKTEPRFRFIDYMVNMWVFGAATNLYKGAILIKNPVSGDPVSITPKNALALTHYCFEAGFTGNRPTQIPRFKVGYIPKTNAFTPGGRRPLEDVDQLYQAFGGAFGYEFLQTLCAGSPPLYNYPNTQVFYQDVKRLYDRLISQDILLSVTPSARLRAMGTELIHRLYWHNFEVDLFDNPSYANLFSQLGVDFGGLDQKQLWAYYQELVVLSLGIPKDTEDQVRRKQELAMQAMRYFSSYAVQYVYSTAVGSPIGLASALPRSNAKLTEQGKTLFLVVASVNHQLSNVKSLYALNPVASGQSRHALQIDPVSLSARASASQSALVRNNIFGTYPVSNVCNAITVTYL